MIYIWRQSQKESELIGDGGRIGQFEVVGLQMTSK